MSDLLNKASLVMIPSGYKEDVVYSQIPTDGAGDLSFTRASNGTRINSAGLVEVCPWNLAGYSEDFSNAYWTKNRSSITANSTTAPNGTTTADSLIESTASGTHEFVTTGLSVELQRYNFSIYAKANTRTKIQLLLAGTPWFDTGNGQASFDLSNGTVISAINGATATIESVGNGWYRCTISKSTISASKSGVLAVQLLDASGNSSYTGDGTSGAFLWGAQLNIGSTAKPYFPTTDRLNVPRLTYQNGGGGCPSLLLEKQATNLALWSEDFTNAVWQIGGSNTVTANAITSPDGTQNADFLVKTATNSSAAYAYQTISSTASPTATIYAKAGAVTEMMFFCQGGNGIYFNLTNGAFVAYYSAGASTITSYSSVAMGNGWYRYSMTFNTSVTTIETYMSVNTNISPSVANGNGFYVWGAQLEASSYPTSYIPTTSSSATRVADACFKTGISSLIGQSEGSVFLDFIPQGGNITQEVFGVTVAGGGIEYIAMYAQTNGNLYFTTNIFTTTLISANAFGQRFKVGYSYKAGTHLLYVNGSQIATSSTSLVYSTLNALYINQSATGTGVEKMTTNEMVLSKTAFTAAELASLTTI